MNAIFFFRNQKWGGDLGLLAFNGTPLPYMCSCHLISICSRLEVFSSLLLSGGKTMVNNGKQLYTPYYHRFFKVSCRYLACAWIRPR